MEFKRNIVRIAARIYEHLRESKFCKAPGEAAGAGSPCGMAISNAGILWLEEKSEEAVQNGLLKEADT